MVSTVQSKRDGVNKCLTLFFLIVIHPDPLFICWSTVQYFCICFRFRGDKVFTYQTPLYYRSQTPRGIESNFFLLLFNLSVHKLIRNFCTLFSWLKLIWALDSLFNLFLSSGSRFWRNNDNDTMEYEFAVELTLPWVKLQMVSFNPQSFISQDTAESEHFFVMTFVSC